MTLDPQLLLRAYASGIFPMADSRDATELYWVEPRLRAIIPIDGFHVSRSLARTLRSSQFKVTRDRDFGGVVKACAERAETWINGEIERAAVRLHELGHAHSIEVWENGSLAGGLYGISLGGAFFGESMFSRSRDASKVAMAWLVARLKAGNFRLLDCQIMTPHLASLGAIEISRDDYVALLSTAVGAGVGAGSGAGVLGSNVGGGPDFLALDALLEAAGAAGADGPSGKVISQLLIQTS